MNPEYRQRGSTLVTALIMLVVLTLLVVSSIRSSNTNLRIAGNMQMQEEAVAAAQQALEQTISYNFTAAPAANNLNVDINNDGVADYAVTVSTPTCLGSVALTNSTPNLPSACLSSGAATNTGIVSASGAAISTSQSWCYEQQWEIQASAVNASIGATAGVHQGVALKVPAGTGCSGP